MGLPWDWMDSNEIGMYDNYTEGTPYADEIDFRRHAA